MEAFEHAWMLLKLDFHHKPSMGRRPSDMDYKLSRGTGFRFKPGYEGEEQYHGLNDVRTGPRGGKSKQWYVWPDMPHFDQSHTMHYPPHIRELMPYDEEMAQTNPLEYHARKQPNLAPWDLMRQYGPENISAENLFEHYPNWPDTTIPTGE